MQRTPSLRHWARATSPPDNAAQGKRSPPHPGLTKPLLNDLIMAAIEEACPQLLYLKSPGRLTKHSAYSHATENSIDGWPAENVAIKS